MGNKHYKQAKRLGKSSYPAVEIKNSDQPQKIVQDNKLKNVLDELQKLKECYDELYEFSPVGFISLNEKYCITQLNFAAASLLGGTKKSLVNNPIDRYISREFQKLFYEYRQQITEAGVKQICELEMKKKDGTIFHARLESIITQEAGNKYFFISLTDITESKLAKLALKKNEEKFLSLIEITKEWVWVIDANERYCYNSPGVETILGYSPKELAGKKRLTLVHEEDQTEACKLFITSSKQTNNWNNRVFRWHHKDGSYRYLETNAAPIIEKDGKICGYRGASRDITSWKEMEEKVQKHQCLLHQASKVNAMKEIASALAHELTQPLTTINNFLTGCLLRLQNNIHIPTEVCNVMQQTVQETKRAGSILHRMKDLVCSGKLYCEAVDVHRVIRETIALVKRDMPHLNVKIHFLPPRSSYYLMADKIQIELVVFNLLRNSIEAIENSVGVFKKEILIYTRLVDCNFAKIGVIDTGPGFKNGEKLFTPYFTTKPHGLGMGLAICRSIIEAHGGQLTATTRPQGGACFEFTLPLSQHT